MNDSEEIFTLDVVAANCDPQIGGPERPYWIVFPCFDMRAWLGGSVWKAAHVAQLKLAMEQAGVAERDFYITYISAYEAPTYLVANNYKPSEGDMRAFMAKVAKYEPKLILAVGETGLNALCCERGIGKWRGSFLFPHGLQTLVMPLYEPSRLFLDPALRYLTQIDFKKIAPYMAQSALPIRTYTIKPTFQEARDYLLYLIEEVSIFSLDIETDGGRRLACVGFCHAPYQAFVIPFFTSRTPNKSYWSHNEEKELFLLLSRLLSDPTKTVIYQNAIFDTTFLYENCRIFSQTRVVDTMALHQLLYPDFDKNLGLLTSIYTLDPYYKDEGKLAFKGQLNEAQYWTYNAKDADVTYRAYFEIARRIKLYGHEQTATYKSDLFPLVYRMGLRGITIDQPLRASLAAKTIERCKVILEILQTKVGYPLNPGSSKQLQAFLYGENNLPVKTKVRKNKNGDKKRTPAADEAALLSIRTELLGKPFLPDTPQDEHRWWLLETIDLIRLYQKLNKLLTTYFLCPISNDGRMRSMWFIPGTETGRFSSKKFYDGTGANLQNQPKLCRAYMVPSSPEKILVNVDLKQADARVVAYESGDPALIALFQSGEDYHKANAKNIFGVASIDAVTGGQRQRAKTGGHAVNYGAQGSRLAEAMEISLSEATLFRSLYLQTYPYISQWHRRVKNGLLKNRTIISALGYKRTFLTRIDHDTEKEALAFSPQSTVAQYINMGWMRFEALGYPARVLLQCHDSLLLEVDKALVDDLIPRLQECIEHPIVLTNGLIFTIPTDFEVGASYGKMLRYLTLNEEEQTRQHLTKGIGVSEIARTLGINKDAVADLAAGKTWR